VARREKLSMGSARDTRTLTVESRGGEPGYLAGHKGLEGGLTEVKEPLHGVADGGEKTERQSEGRD